MREIKFRAIPKDMYEEHVDTTLDTISFYNSQAFDGTFVYGHLNGEYILGDTIEVAEDYYYPSFWILVDTNTIGQYTGLEDKNGKKIYEGDIIRFLWGSISFRAEVTFSKGAYVLKNQNNSELNILRSRHVDLLLREVGNCEVIGNIHEGEVE
jgi:uncharacterized phage protein (TIGR01671 family)